MSAQDNIRKWKEKTLDSKSASFCGAKWFNASIWVWSGTTASCYHNPTHQIDLEAIKLNPKALHNTPIKKLERQMMQKGEKPVNCQFCWVMEDLDSKNLADRTWQSTLTSDDELQRAFDTSHEEDFNLEYLEIGLDKTCQLACSYCNPAISSSWVKDIKQNGPYKGLITDTRNHYTATHEDSKLFDYKDVNPYAEAFFKWWETDLHKTLKQLRITGGEPAMSGHLWKLFDWIINNPNKSQAKIELTTNLMYEKEKVDRLIDFASKVDNKVEIWTSCECIGEKQEYIRDGFEWSIWTNNVTRLLESNVIQKIVLLSTLSNIACDGFLEFLEWVIEQKIIHGKNKITVGVNPVRFPTFQNVIVLPMDMRIKYNKELKFFMSQNGSMFDPYETDVINRFIDYLLDVEIPHQEISHMSFEKKLYEKGKNVLDVDLLEKDFKRFFVEYDKRRTKDFEKAFPNLKDWYDGIQL